jgi:hypothetical protein
MSISEYPELADGDGAVIGLLANPLKIKLFGNHLAQFSRQI